MRPEDVLTLALAAAAARIHPRPGLDRIRARTAFDAAMAPLTAQRLLTDHTRTAAPEHTRDGRPAHNETKETTVTILAQPHTDSVRGRQLTAALALAKILEHDLPLVHWFISPTSSDSLRGHIDAFGRTGAQIREDIARYAEFLCASVTEEDEDIPLPRLAVQAIYRNVPIRVWAYKPADDEQKAEAQS